MTQTLEDISAFLDIDEFGNFIDSDGNFVNKFGQLIDDFGNLLEDGVSEGLAAGDKNDEITEDTLTEKEDMPQIQNIQSTTKSVDGVLEVAHDLRNTVLNIPLKNIRELCRLGGTIQISVHGVILSVDASVFAEQFGVDVSDIYAVRAITAALEERLSPQDAKDLRSKQVKAMSSGAAFKIEEGEVIHDLESFKVVIPDLVSKVKIELSDIEIPLEGMKVLNAVKADYVKQARGLDKVLKTGAAIEILNAVQTAGYDTEIDFYMTLLTKMDKDSPTVKMALAQLRLLMQYAVNVDNLELKAVLTEVFVNGGK